MYINTHVYVYIYIGCVKLLSGPSLALSGVIIFVLRLFWEKLSFSWLLKHWKIGFQEKFVFLLFKEKNKAPKHYNWNFFLFRKWPFRDSYLFSKIGLLRPLFLWCFWVRAAFFGPSCQKREFWTTPQKEILTDHWKARVLVFFSFLVVFVICFGFLLGLRVRWGGPKGHLTWP